MSFKTEIKSVKAPKAIGPYSQAICVNGIIFCSGQLPVDVATGKLVEGDVTAQTHQSFKNVLSILEEAGLTRDNIVKTTVYLADIKDFAAMNTVYSSYLEGPFPARSCVQVAALPMGALVEIEVTCVRGAIAIEA